MDFSKMNGYEFERFITSLLFKLGFKARQTSLSGDGGVDIEAIHDKPLFKGLYLIQCKNWANPVGQPQVRDLYGVVMSRRANKGVLITTSSFTDQAKQFAEGLNIELIDGRLLNEIIASVESSESATIGPHDLGFLDNESFEKDRYTYLKNKLESNRDYNSYEEFLAFLLSYVQPCFFSLLKQGLDKEIISICDEMLSRFCKSNKRDAEKRNEHFFIKGYLYFVTGQIASCIECLNEIGLFQFNMRADNYVPCTLSFPMHTDHDRSHSRTIGNCVLYDYCNHRNVMVTNLFILANTIDDNDLEAFETFINKGITAQTFKDSPDESTKVILYLADYTLDAINQIKHMDKGYKWYPYFFHLQKGNEYSISNTCYKSRAVEVKETLVDNWDSIPQIRNDMNKMARMLGFIGASTGSSSEFKETDRFTADPQTLHSNNMLLLKHAYKLLESGDWVDADEYSELALDFDSENAEVYLVKLMAELHVKTLDALKNHPQPFDNLKNYQQVMRFGDESLKKELDEAIASIKVRNEVTHKEGIYTHAVAVMKKGTEQGYLYAKQEFLGISSYKDANTLALLCDKKVEECRKKAEEFMRQVALLAQVFKSWLEADNEMSLNQCLAAAGIKSFEEAIAIYTQNPKILHAVNAIYPAASSSALLLGKADSGLLGRYKQKEDGQPEPIEWKVLAREKDRILVISKYALDCMPFCTSDDESSWDTCSLRKWLNEVFFNAAFNHFEKSIIHRVTNYTADKVFLLSIKESNMYFDSNQTRRCAATCYAVKQGSYTDKRYKIDGMDTCIWWLRSSGEDAKCVAFVNDSGYVNVHGFNVKSEKISVRPAMWISIGIRQ